MDGYGQVFIAAAVQLQWPTDRNHPSIHLSIEGKMECKTFTAFSQLKRTNNPILNTLLFESIEQKRRKVFYFPFLFFRPITQA